MHQLVKKPKKIVCQFEEKFLNFGIVTQTKITTMKTLKINFLIAFLMLPYCLLAQSQFAKYFNEAQETERNGYGSKALENYLKAERYAQKSFEKNRVWK